MEAFVFPSEPWSQAFARFFRRIGLHSSNPPYPEEAPAGASAPRRIGDVLSCRPANAAGSSERPRFTLTRPLTRRSPELVLGIVRLYVQGIGAGVRCPDSVVQGLRMSNLKIVYDAADLGRA